MIHTIVNAMFVNFSVATMTSYVICWPSSFKNEKSKDYSKADQHNVYCFLITIFRLLAIPAFFRFTDVTVVTYQQLYQYYCDSYHKFSDICKQEEGWYGQPKYCYEKTIHVVLISFAVIFGLLLV